MISQAWTWNVTFDEDGRTSPSPEPLAQADGAPDEDAPHVISGLPVESADEARRRVEGDLEQLKDRHVRLAAEFDNFRKRVAKERAELTERAQAALVGRLLDALDDLHRIIESDPVATPPTALREGIAAVERKVFKELNAAGLERIDPAGGAFDPSVHEAVSTAPAPDAASDQQVSQTFQSGYRFKGHLVRPARVQVYSGRDGA